MNVSQLLYLAYCDYDSVQIIMVKLSSQLISDVTALLHQGLSLNEITRRLSVSKGSVYLIKQKYVPDRIGCAAGRPRLLDNHSERLIVRQINSGDMDTATEVAKNLQETHRTSVHPNTIRRVLKRNGLHGRAKVKKPLLSAKHVRDRLSFARKYADWTVEDWKQVIWSDETKINRFGSDGRKWCWKSRGGQLKPNHITNTVKFGGGSIMVWGCFTTHGVGYLAKIDDGLDASLYCDILDDELKRTVKYYRMDRKKLVFQHDNDPKHTARVTQEKLRELGYSVLFWPTQSPDLNPIEHLWVTLKRRLSKYERVPSSMGELWDRVQVEWNTITQNECLHLIESMPERVAAVIRAKGRHTKF